MNSDLFQKSHIFLRMQENWKILMRGFKRMATEQTFLLNTNCGTFGDSLYVQKPVSNLLLTVWNNSANSMEKK